MKVGELHDELSSNLPDPSYGRPGSFDLGRLADHPDYDVVIETAGDGTTEVRGVRWDHNEKKLVIEAD